jgi:Ca-activated chloride channel family protein
MMPENKLPLVQRSLTMLVDNLRAQDRIGIVVYASGTRVVLPSTPGDQKLRIKEAINSLTAGGSTAGAAGIQLAYDTAASSMIRGGNNRVILCTDGDFNVGLSSMTALEELVVNNRNRGIFLTVLGYGMGNYKDNKIELLANRGNGNYAYIDTIMEAKKVLVNEIGSTLYTIAKDVKIQAEFNPAHVRGYRLIGYENRLLRPEEFRDDTVDAGELGAGHTVTAIYEIIPSSSREPVAELDSLRYQSIRISPEARQSPELMTVKLRYKQPNGETSIPLDQQVLNRPVRLRETSERYRFSAAVVGYGLMLQNSRFKGNLHWEMVKELAANSMSSDPHGYKAEFMELIQKAIRLGSGD